MVAVFTQVVSEADSTPLPVEYPQLAMSFIIPWHASQLKQTYSTVRVFLAVAGGGWAVHGRDVGSLWVLGQAGGFP